MYKDDIRRFDFEAEDFNGVVQRVADAFGLPSHTVRLHYVDEEQDTVSIGSSAELMEAFEVANEAGRKALKLLVSSVDPEIAANSDDDVVAVSVNNVTVTDVTNEEDATSDDDDDDDVQYDEEEDEKKEPRLSMAVLADHLLKLLSANDVVDALPTALQAFFAVVQDEDNVETVVDTFIASTDAIAQHPSTHALRSLLPLVASSLQRWLSFARANPQLLATAQNFAPLVVPMLVPQARQVLQAFKADPSTGCQAAQAAFLPLAHMLGPNVGDLFKCSSEDTAPAVADDTPVATAHDASSQGVHVHRSVRCDGCGVFPIKGDRYKCSVCK